MSSGILKLWVHHIGFAGISPTAFTKPLFRRLYDPTASPMEPLDGAAGIVAANHVSFRWRPAMTPQLVFSVIVRIQSVLPVLARTHCPILTLSQIQWLVPFHPVIRRMPRHEVAVEPHNVHFRPFQTGVFVHQSLHCQYGVHSAVSVVRGDGQSKRHRALSQLRSSSLSLFW